MKKVLLGASFLALLGACNSAAEGEENENQSDSTSVEQTTVETPVEEVVSDISEIETDSSLVDSTAH